MEDRLQKFARLVSAGSFTQASAELHISQPALSQSISKLERELRTPLLVRNGRGLQLTEAGRIAYSAAKELQLTADNLRLKLADLAQQQLSLSVGMIDSIASGLLATGELLSQLQKEAHISIDVHNSRHLLERMVRGQLDVAFVVHRPAMAHAALDVQMLGNESLVAVCHRAIHAQIQQTLTTGALKPFISYDQPSVTHGIVLSGIERYGLSAQPAFYSTSPDVMLRLVLLQKGAAVLPYSQVKPHIDTKELVLLCTKEPIVINRPIARMSHKGKALAGPLATITAHVTRLLASGPR